MCPGINTGRARASERRRAWNSASLEAEVVGGEDVDLIISERSAIQEERSQSRRAMQQTKRRKIKDEPTTGDDYIQRTQLQNEVHSLYSTASDRESVSVRSWSCHKGEVEWIQGIRSE